MKTLVILFAIGLMSPLLCEGLGLCMTACNSDFCEGGCKIKGYFPECAAVTSAVLVVDQ